MRSTNRRLFWPDSWTWVIGGVSFLFGLAVAGAVIVRAIAALRVPADSSPLRVIGGAVVLCLSVYVAFVAATNEKWGVAISVREGTVKVWRPFRLPVALEAVRTTAEFDGEYLILRQEGRQSALIWPAAYRRTTAWEIVDALRTAGVYTPESAAEGFVEAAEDRVT